MPGLDSGTHVSLQSRMRVDGRVKPGHDEPMGLPKARCDWDES
jgi:hypothetical protein